MASLTKEALKSALSRRLKSIVDPKLTLKAKKLSLLVSELNSKEPQAQLDLVFLTRVEGYYLQAHVYGGRLCEEVSRLSLPKEANNLLAGGLFFLSTLSERSSRFTHDIGGARLIHHNSDPDGAAEDSIGAVRDYYFPIVSSILRIDNDLPDIVVEHAQFFSYPLTTLAVLEKRYHVGRRFSELYRTPEATKLFKKESRLDIPLVLRSA